jgi:AhpD family alkylhydroperoxidase
MNVEHGHLTTLNLLTTDTAPVGSRAILESTVAQLGMVPNLYAEMAHSPGLFSTYRLGYDQFRGDSGFDKIEQEIVLLAISRFHECKYCVAVHSVVADRNNVPVEVTDAIRLGQPIPDPKLEALNKFTTTMLITRGRPSADDLEQFLTAGYTELFVLEIILAIAVKTISNYTNHLFDTPLDEVFSHRIWAPAKAI